MDFIYETLEGGEELENFIIEKRLPHLRDPKVVLPLWEDAIETWNTKSHPELERSKQLLLEWLVWMREADVLVPPFTDLPIKFKRDSAPPVDIEAYTTQTIVNSIETKLRDKMRKQVDEGRLHKERLEGGVVLDEIDDNGEVGEDEEGEEDLNEWFEGTGEGDQDSFLSEKTSTETLTPFNTYADGIQQIYESDRLTAGAKEDIAPYDESIDCPVEIIDTWTFTTEEKEEW